MGRASCARRRTGRGRDAQTTVAGSRWSPAPIIYEVAGITPPEVYRGLEQMPVTGTSLAYTFGDANAPDAKTARYFEMMGHRALYLDGWKAVTRHEHGVVPFDEDRWELYHLAEDVSACHDLAAVEPERLAAMVARWWEEAEEHDVLPLDERTLELFGARSRERSPHPAVAPLPLPVADEPPTHPGRTRTRGSELGRPGHRGPGGGPGWRALRLGQPELGAECLRAR